MTLIEGGELEILKCPRKIAEEKLKTEILPEDKERFLKNQSWNCLD